MDRGSSPFLKAALGLVLISIVMSGGAAADDRDLLRDSSGSPYMFITMDTSGSMHWTPACTEEDACLDIDPWDGKCTQECTNDLDICRRLCPDYGCVEYDFGTDPPRDIEVILDNTDQEGVEIIGNWRVGGVEPWIGEDYLHNDRSGQGTKSVRFTPNFAEASTYHVYLYWSANSGRASNVPIDIVHKNGADTVTDTVTVNQRQGHGEWNFVGTYDFAEGDEGSVLVRTDGTTGYVAVDAVRFYSLIKPDTPPACLRSGYRCQQDLCPKGDCFATLGADDPTSKFYQAKQALYEVLETASDLHFGFGSYEQDNARLKSKHWLYRVAKFKPQSEDFPPSTPQDLFWNSSSEPVPEVGGELVFGNGPPYDDQGRGDGWNCASNDNYPGKGSDVDGDAGHVGCFYEEPADASNDWEMERLHRIPKLGRLANQDTTVWYRRDGTVYRLVFSPAVNADGQPFAYGDVDFAVNVERTACPTSSCNGAQETKTIYFELVSDFAAWEGALRRPPMRGNGFFHYQTNVAATNTCNGLEPNNDRNGNVDPNLSNANDDTWWDYTYKWPTTEDPRRTSVLDANGDPVDWFDVGDFVPLDWLSHQDRLLQERLAPNIVGGAAAPDFRTAVFWQDDHLSTSDPNSPTNRRLRLENEDERPLLAYGSTPIGGSLEDFRTWYSKWSLPAAERDIDWACRQKYVLFLTDGNETCGGDPCEAAAQLLKEGVKTYVVGFGLDDTSSNLGCIAREGGTEEPILPRNKDELVKALEDILLEIRAESRSFASASIPAIQSSSADKILLSSFIPLPETPWWPAKVDVFRKPLPLLNGKPNTTLKCSPLRQSACHLFDVGEVMLKQVPDDLTEDTPKFGLGATLNERRVIYESANLSGHLPGKLQLFHRPYRGPDGDDLAALEDLGDVLVEPDTMAEYYATNVDADFIEDLMVDVMVETLREKPLDLESDEREAYVLGDVFHANPKVIPGPSRVDYFGLNLCGKETNGPNNCVDGQDRGYRNFTERHTWRRRLLVVAANDGQLHFFDAGTRNETTVPTGGGRTETQPFFSDGTGRELFSYMPRLTMPVVREQATGDRHIFSVDGGVTIGDVFMDPQYGNEGPKADEREWRTVVVAGLREAGDRYENADEVEDYVRGYYALDITQPDILKREDGEYVPVNKSLAENTVELPSCMGFDFGTTGAQKIVDAGEGNDAILPCRYPFPAALWSFTDTVAGGYFLDEENNGAGNGRPDLGDTWSEPVIGQVAVIEDGQETVKHVAIFGGGLDPDFKSNPQRGTFLYMVNIETGEAIYKREVEGSVPSQPTVLDTDQDGIFDVLYVGTTAGILYKVDLAKEIPYLDEYDVRSRLLPSIGSGSPINVLRVDENAWKPFPILETNGTPIYFAPTAFPIPQLGRYGLAIGTGDREDLWEQNAEEGRFYVIVDTKFSADQVGVGSCKTRLPIQESCLQKIAWDGKPPTLAEDSSRIDNTINYVISPDPFKQRGWMMTFPSSFRMTSDPFMASGILFYSFFQPIAFIPNSDGGEVCARTGITRSFVVLAKNGNPVARLSGDPQASDPVINGEVVSGSDGSGVEDPGASTTGSALNARDRYHKIGEFTTAPFIDRVSSKNAPAAADTGTTFVDLVDPELERDVLKTVMDDYPRGSRFNEAFRLAVAALRNSTGVHIYATVPVAIYPADWREGTEPAVELEEKEQEQEEEEEEEAEE